MSHFFGQIVLYQKEFVQKKYNIDGKQRISTAIILLDSFRKINQEIYEEGKLDTKYEAKDLTTIYIEERLIRGSSNVCFKMMKIASSLRNLFKKKRKYLYLIALFPI